jgi:signal transduction histidine kinase
LVHGVEALPRNSAVPPDEQPILLSGLPPSDEQVRAALTVAVLLFVAFLITLPFGDVQLARVDAFIPIVDTVLFLGDLITAALLFAQFSVLRSRALLALACGYLFTSLIIVPHALTFPGAFSATGLLGANLQTTVWLYILWHVGLPPAVIVYALLKDTDPGLSLAHGSARTAILASIAAIVLVVCALSWLVTAGVGWVPSIMVDAMHATPRWHDIVAPILLLLSVIAVALLWIRRRSVLDLWLLIVLWAWLIETVLLRATAYRFSLVWYAGRIYGILSTSVVLLVLLSESTMLYARLAVSVLSQRREREARLMTMDAMSAAIAHEIKQPLGAIVMSANAGQRWLRRAPPDIDEACDAFSRIAADGHRSSEVIQSVRAMFSNPDQSALSALPLNLNEIVRETIALVRDRSKAVESNGVVISVEDSGRGIEPKNIRRIFDAFFTTKSGGMGMGLAICRSIVEAHGGTLSVSSGVLHGSVFRLVLPGSR